MVKTRAALRLWADGTTIDDIAVELALPPRAIARLIRAGMETLGVRTQAELITALGSGTTPVMIPSLTPSERAVVALVLAGASNKEIALQRGTSLRTVANQLQSIYGKALVGSRRELVALLLDSRDSDQR